MGVKRTITLCSALLFGLVLIISITQFERPALAEIAPVTDEPGSDAGDSLEPGVDLAITPDVPDAKKRLDNPESGTGQQNLAQYPEPPVLEAGRDLADLYAEFSMIREQGPEAVLAFTENLTGTARDMLQDEMEAAMEALWEPPARPENIMPLSLEEEMSHNQAALEQANLLRGDTLQAEPREFIEDNNAVIIEPQEFQMPEAIGASFTVGNGCTYSSINAAIAAASPGDTILLEGGRVFYESVSIGKNIALDGGYSGCDSGSSSRTTIDAGGSGMAIWTQDWYLSVALYDLNITNSLYHGISFGQSGEFGTGGDLYLSNINIYNNHGDYGAGLSGGALTTITGTNVSIHDNIATYRGGAIELHGGQLTLYSSSVYSNYAGDKGGGIYGGTFDGTQGPVINLYNSGIFDNRTGTAAETVEGYGGGIYLESGSARLADGSDLYRNEAINGGGAYVLAGTLTLDGRDVEVWGNDAQYGGGVYATASSVNIDNYASISNNEALYNGGGAYFNGGVFYLDVGKLHYNSAGGDGGAIYATNNAYVDMDTDIYACSGTRCSSLYKNSANSWGGGICAYNSTVDLRETWIDGNTAYFGGGIYAYGSSIYLRNTLIQVNDASSNTGDGIRLFGASSLSGEHITLAYNNADGYGTGHAIDLSDTSSTVNISNSIIWGHSSSINDASQIVTCSDIEGGYTGTDNINQDPKFNMNSHLDATSPAVDQCATGSSVDVDDLSRPVVIHDATKPYDMGADEALANWVGINNSGCQYNSLSYAEEMANAGDLVQAATGTYVDDLVIAKPIDIHGGYASDCLTPDTGMTTLDKNSNGELVYVSSNVQDVTLQNLTLRDGYNYFGGGMYLSPNSQVLLDNTDIMYNQAIYGGGGVYIGSGALVTASNGSHIAYNTADDSGGGVYVNAGHFIANDNDSHIYSNTASWLGGGIYVTAGGTLTLHDSDVSFNGAMYGGGIYANSNTIVTIESSSFIWDNNAYNGAGLYAQNSSIILENAYFRQNKATWNGGAIYLYSSDLAASPAYIGQVGNGYENTADFGAGIYARYSNVDLQGSIINNIAEYGGAGLYAYESEITLSDTQVGGINSYESNILTGISSPWGAGLACTGNTHLTLDNTDVISNASLYANDAEGGGIYLGYGSILTATNSTIQQNTVNGEGGGLIVEAATATLYSCNVLNNIASNYGGGVRVDTDGTLHALDSVFVNNHAGSWGGAISGSSSNTAISLMDSDLLSNSAGSGGAVDFEYGTLDIAGDWVFQDNWASGGGAIAAWFGADVGISAGSQSYFAQNTASSVGGALYVVNSTVDIANTIFRDNVAPGGGAIYQTGSLADTSIRNTLIYNNDSVNSFGASIRSAGGLIDIRNSTLAHNLTGSGYSQISTTATINNSIGWGNANGGFIVESGTLTGDCNTDQSENIGTNLDPQFIDPVTGDFHLEGTSPAVDVCASGLSTDLDGNLRPDGLNFDMGAYETRSPDTIAPTSEASTLTLTNVNPLAVSWMADDDYTGVKSTQLWYKFGSEGTWFSTGLTQSGTSGTFSYHATSGDGTYYFATVATDNEGNTETTPSGDGDTSVVLDTAKPASNANSPAYVTSDTVAITWTASDSRSGVSSTRLWIKLGDGTWTSTGLTQSGTSGTFDYDPGSRDGIVYFATVSTDVAGNVEANPINAGDSSTVVDRSLPSSTVIVPTKVYDSQLRLSWSASDQTSGVSETELWVKIPNGSWEPTGLTSSGTSGTFAYTLENSGTYYFASVATDRAGNVESRSSDGSLLYYAYRVFQPFNLQNFRNFYPWDWETEPNDSYLLANGPIISSKTYQGYLIPDIDGWIVKDYYSFYAEKPGQIKIELLKMAVNTGQLFLFYEDTGHRVTYNNAVGQGCTLTFDDAQPGWYYVYINATSDYNVTQPYSLKVTYP